ncbi:hypothetical protein GCM10010420_45710 [Streptomyces glaucosporus]|uniref:Uncharacterized protein n=1 Tax=Streptomyces glaucosporus TaxID=284044 RepID=A0ABN3ISQ0_9ACTN
MSETRCKRCDLLVGMGCACSPRGNGGQGRKRSGSGGTEGKRRREQPVTVRRTAASKAPRGGKRPNPAPPRPDHTPWYGDDRGAAEFRAELRDITERGTSVRTVSGGLPGLGRRR